MVKRSNNARGRGQSGGKTTRRAQNGKAFGSTRRPKPFRVPNSASQRAAANSVFANAPGNRKGKPAQKLADDDANAEIKRDDRAKRIVEAEFAATGHRLQKVLAAAGYGSRRQCEELILDGRVEVDGTVVAELGTRVFPQTQKIRVDGEALPKAKPIYVAFNKPKNTLCTNNDPQGRRRALDFMPAQLGRLFPVGRLDQNSEGLIVMTNDGALAERLTHPRFETPKKYRAQVAGLVDYRLVEALKRGVHIAEGIVQADEVVIKARHKLSSILEITLTEGKNREIRRMLARVGHKVLQLQRVQVGSIKLGKLAPGDFRLLTSREVAELYDATREQPEGKVSAAFEEKRPRRAPIEIADFERELNENVDDKPKERSAKGGKNGKFGRPGGAKFGGERSRREFGRRFDRDERNDFDGDFDGENDERFDGSFERNLGGERRWNDFDEDDGGDERGSRRRGPRAEFREEFRSEERRDRRRRVRREYDDEERTIGPRKFDREDDDRPRERRFGGFGNEFGGERRQGGKRFGGGDGGNRFGGSNRNGGARGGRKFGGPRGGGKRGGR